jgi:hypothetical protein
VERTWTKIHQETSRIIWISICFNTTPL